MDKQSADAGGRSPPELSDAYACAEAYKTEGLFLYENHKNGRFRIFGGRKCCPGKTVVLECVSEADETICTGWEVIAH